jgi:hypothetical protein
MIGVLRIGRATTFGNVMDNPIVAVRFVHVRARPVLR